MTASAETTPFTNMTTRRLTPQRVLGRSLLSIAGAATGIALGLVGIGALYLPTVSPQLLLGAAAGLILLVIAGGVLSSDRPRSIAAGTSVILIACGALFAGTTYLNLGASDTTLLQQLPIDQISLTRTDTPDVLPDGHTTVTILADPATLTQHLRDHGGLTGETTLSKPLGLGKALEVTVTPGSPEEPTRLDINVIQAP